MVARNYLRLGLIGCLLATTIGQEDATFTQHGKEIKFLGKSAKFEITTGNSSMKVSFGAIQELDVRGTPVNGRRVVELASIRPIFQQGYALAADSTNVSFVRLHVPLNRTALQYSTSGCSSPTVTQADFQTGFMDIIYYFGFSNDTEFQYGFNNTLVAPGNSNKFSLQAANWPFCANGNTLQIDLLLHTGEGHGAKARQSHFNNTEAEFSGTNGDARHLRKMLNLQTWQVVNRGQGNGGNGQSNGNGNSNGNGGSNDNGGSNGHSNKHPQRDPHVAGRLTHQIALLMNSTAAATLDLESYAYDSETGTTVYNVSTSMSSQEDNTLVRLVFPTFSSIYYDPTVAVGVSAVDAGYTASDLASTTTTSHNSAATPLRLGVTAGLAGAMLMLVLL